MKTPLRMIFSLVLFAASLSAFAKDKVTSPVSAVLMLLLAASEYHLAIEAGPGEYYVGVDDAMDIGEYFLIDLRRTNETLPADWVGSNLVGWFGVRKKDGVIVEWDVAEDRPGEIIRERPNPSPHPTRASGPRG